MKIFDLNNISPRTVIPGFHGKFIHSDKATISFWEIEAGHDLPEHSHIHEQTTLVLNGTFQLNIEEKRYTLKSNQLITIPPDKKHSGTAITDCNIIDVFCPVREDYQ